MRVAQPAVLVVIGALLSAVGLSCSQKSSSDTSADGGDGGGGSGDGTDSSIGQVLGDDGGLDVYEAFETGTLSGDGGPCTIPGAAYTVTATPTDDGGSQCPAWTSIVIPPGPSATGPCLGGPGTGSWQPDGMLPVCALDFTCSGDNGQYTTVTTGSVEVFEGTYAGTAESQVYSDVEAGVPLYMCTYHLDYALKQ